MAILALPPLIRPRFAGKRALQNIESVSEVQISTGSQKLDTRKFMLLMASAVTINLLVIAGINI